MFLCENDLCNAFLNSYEWFWGLWGMTCDVQMTIVHFTLGCALIAFPVVSIGSAGGAVYDREIARGLG